MSIKITMSQKEKTYEQVCIRMHKNKLPLKKAAIQAGVSTRHMRRIFTRYNHGGATALCHKRRGKPGTPQFTTSDKNHILHLLTTTYVQHSPAYASELLSEEHSISISPPTIRTWLRANNAYPSVKPIKHTYRAYRPRQPAFGALIQADGSFHHWFGQHYPQFCLLVLIDDATNIVSLRFAHEEYAQDMLILLHSWIIQYGIPETLYFDRRNAYTSKSHTSYINQVSRRLGTSIINARSPQAKGRVERVNRTLQGRLVADLARFSITSIDDANSFLHSYFIHHHNNRFALSSCPIHNAHVPLFDRSSLDKSFAFHFERTLRNDWTISIDTLLFQILPPPPSLRLRPKSRILCTRFLDNSIHLFYNNYELTFKEVYSHLSHTA